MKKSHWIVLIVLVVLTAVYFLARSRQPVEKEIRFFKADSVDVYKLEFFTPADTIIVSRDADAWRLVYPVDWEVNQQQLEYFFTQVLPIKTSATPMSDDPNLQNMYKVNADLGIQVKVYDRGGKLLDHAYIGNGANTTYDYGRRQGDRKIYQFKSNITNLVKPDIFLWRSTNITNLKRGQIDFIDVTYTKNAYTLTVLADSIRYSDSRETFMIPLYNRAQHKVINALENLVTWQFIDKDTEQWKAAFEKPECRIEVHLKDKKVRTFTLIRKVTPLEGTHPNEPDKDVYVLMMVDDRPSPLYQMTGDFINRFTRAAMHFKVEYD